MANKILNEKITTILAFAQWNGKLCRMYGKIEKEKQGK